MNYKQQNMESLIIKAAESPKIRTSENIVDSLQNIIARIHLLRGQDVSADDLNFMSSEFANELKECYSYLTIAEVTLALSKGLKGEYGKYFGLNVITFIDWIKAYITSQERQEAIKALQLRQLPQKTELTADEIERICKENLRNAWISRKQGYYFPLTGSYSYLKSKNLLPTVDKVALKKEAQKRVEKRLKSKRAGVIINSLGAEINIINEAKTIVVERFLDSISEEKLNEITTMQNNTTNIKYQGVRC